MTKVAAKKTTTNTIPPSTTPSRMEAPASEVTSIADKTFLGTVNGPPSRQIFEREDLLLYIRSARSQLNNIQEIMPEIEDWEAPECAEEVRVQLAMYQYMSRIQDALLAIEGNVETTFHGLRKIGLVSR